MGRRKIEIQPITNERGRSVTFLKRKNGLFKKAYELGVLCSVDVAVIIFEQRTGHHVKLYEYCSSDVGSMIQRHIHFDGEKDARGPADFNNKQDGQGDDDDEDEADDGTGAISSKVGAKMGSGNKGAGISIGFGSGFGMDQDYRSEYQRSMSIPQPPLHQLQIPATPVQGQPSPSLYSATAHQSNAATLPVSIERHTSSASSNSSHNHHSHNHHHPGNNGYHTNQKTRINSGITGSYSQYGTLDESATPISAPAGSTPASASFRIQSNIFSQQSSNPQSSAAGGGASEQLSHYVNLQQSRAQQRGSQGSLHSPYSAGSYINQSYTGTGNQAASSSFSLLLEPGSIYRTHQTSAAPLSATSTSAFDWPVHANDHGPRSAHPSSGSSPQSHNFPARPQSQPANHQQNQTGDVTWLDFLSGTSSGGPNAANMNSGNAPHSTLSSLQQRRADDSWERGSHHSSTSTSQHGGTTPPSANLSKRQRSGSTSGVHIKEEPEGGGIGRASVVLGNATNGNVGETDIDELSDTSGSASGERKRQRWGEVN